MEQKNNPVPSETFSLKCIQDRKDARILRMWAKQKIYVYQQWEFFRKIR